MKTKAFVVLFLTLSSTAFASNATEVLPASVTVKDGTISLNITGEGAQALYVALTGVEDVRLGSDQYDVVMMKSGKNVVCYLRNVYGDSTSKCVVRFDLFGGALIPKETTH